MAVVKLKSEVKSLWLEALRSGKYIQGRNYLQKDGQFCCLGVLSEVYRNAGNPINIDASCSGCVCYDENDSVLPVAVWDWAFEGLNTHNYFVQFRDARGHHPGDEYSGFCTLAFINDCGKYDFNQIADIIEKHL